MLEKKEINSLTSQSIHTRGSVDLVNAMLPFSEGKSILLSCPLVISTTSASVRGYCKIRDPGVGVFQLSMSKDTGRLSVVIDDNFLLAGREAESTNRNQGRNSA